MKLFLTISFLFFLLICQGQGEFGIICGECKDKIAAAKAVGVNWLRITVELDGYQGRNICQEYYDAGLNVIATIKWAKNNTDTFLTDTAFYALMLDSFIRNNLEMPQRLFLVIGNEQLNRENNYGSTQDYINQLTAAINVASKYNLSIADGGIGFSILKIAVFTHTMDAHYWDSAYKFSGMCVAEGIVKRLQKPDDSLYRDLSCFDSLIDAFKNISYPFFYPNLHYYSPPLAKRNNDSSFVNSIDKDTSYILKTAVSWLVANTGKVSIICNEMGQLNQSPGLVRSMLKSATNAGISLIIWHAGDDPFTDINVRAYGLFEDYNTLKLAANGRAFRNWINNYTQ